MSEISDRLALPLLSAAQAQKEVTHNEALALIDIAVQPVVEAVGPGAVPDDPTPGQCWIVGDAPTGAWADRAGAIAGWTAGGWRFIAPKEGMSAWSVADGTIVQRKSGVWTTGALTARTLFIEGVQVVGERQPEVVAPAGGSTVDNEARSAIASLIGRLAAHGLIAI